MKIKALFLIAVSFLLAVMLAGNRAMAQGNDFVVFTANWCANCRVIVPIVQEIGSSNGIRVHLIDVDRQDAPKQAQGFGLAIPKAELPQVYYVKDGHITLVFDASNFRYGMEDQVRATILDNLSK